MFASIYAKLAIAAAVVLIIVGLWGLYEHEKVTVAQQQTVIQGQSADIKVEQKVNQDNVAVVDDINARAEAAIKAGEDLAKRRLQNATDESSLMPLIEEKSNVPVGEGPVPVSPAVGLVLDRLLVRDPGAGGGDADKGSQAGAAAVGPGPVPAGAAAAGR